MRAFSFQTDKGQAQIGVEYQDGLYNFSAAWELYKQLKNNGRGPELNFLQIMVEADFFHAETFQEVLFDLKEIRPIDDLKLGKDIQFLPPINRPQKILCVGRNYRAHAEELGNETPKAPVFFCKPPSALIGHQGKIRLPKGVGEVHHEGELAVIISKTTKQVSKKQAFDHIAGFTLVNDVTARALQKQDQGAGLPWFRSKGFDTFCPVGPFLVPRAAILDHRSLELQVSVNGEVRQEASTAQMIFDLDELVSHLSGYCTLEPGDIIATGTPAGVGKLSSGDEVQVTIKEIGTLVNTVE